MEAVLKRMINKSKMNGKTSIGKYRTAGANVAFKYVGGIPRKGGR